MSRLDDAISADPFGGVGYLISAVGRSWVEKRLADLRAKVPKGTPELASVLAVMEGHPIVSGLYSQIAKSAIGADRGVQAISGDLMQLSVVGRAIRDAGFPERKRLQQRLRDQEDCRAVFLEALTANGYRQLGFPPDWRKEGPEFLVPCSSPVAIECKAKVRFQRFQDEAIVGSRICGQVVDELKRRGEVAFVQLSVTDEPKAGDATALILAVAALLDRGETAGQALGGRYTIDVHPLPRDFELTLSSLPTSKGVSVFWWGAPGGPLNFAGGLNAIKVALETPDRMKQIGDLMGARLEDSLHNLPAAGPGVAYLCTPPASRRRTNELLDLAEAEVAHRLSSMHRINAVVIATLSSEEVSLQDGGVFIDGRVVLNPAPASPLPDDFVLLTPQLLGEQMETSFMELAEAMGWDHGRLTPEEARERGIFMPNPGN